MTWRHTLICPGALRRACFGIALIFAVCAGAARTARAQDTQAATVDRLTKMNQKALDDYDILEFDSAKRTLLEALILGKKSGLDTHPVLARTYVHLGAVYITGYKDRQKALQSFVRALEIDPGITIQKSMLSSEMAELFAQAAKQAKPRPAPAPTPPPPAPAHAPTPPPAPAPPVAKPAPVIATPPAPAPVATPAPRRGTLSEGAEVPPPPPPPQKAAGKSDDADSDEPDLPVHINALDCPVGDESPPLKSVSVRCAVAPELGVTSVALFYREPGAEDFVEAPMTKTPKGWFVGRIPKKVVTGKAVQFFFEARDKNDKPIASNGRSDSPNLILIRERREGDSSDSEDASGRQADAEENPLEEKGEGPPRFGLRRWWIGLMAGTGLGYAKGNGPEARTELNGDFLPGTAWSSLGHLAPEIGFHITPGVALSLQGRNQYIPQAKKYEKYAATGANSVMARLLVFSAQRRVRFYGAAMAGGGEGFRLVIYPDAKDPNFKDTVRGGPWLAGLGAGLTAELGASFSLVLEINELIGLPIFSTVTDAHAGFQINFR
ncbi:MAG TPA: tetratricopeptide repeat protein [Polyangia bacterium]|nr:tetratricopeptide repeat protein [Polyangia bacterium]